MGDISWLWTAGEQKNRTLILYGLRGDVYNRFMQRILFLKYSIDGFQGLILTKENMNSRGGQVGVNNANS